MEAGAKDWTIGEERTGAMMVLILVCAIVLLCRILMFEMFDSNGEGLVCCYLRVCILQFMVAEVIEAPTIQIVEADLISFEDSRKAMTYTYRRGSDPDRELVFLLTAPCGHP